MGAGDSGLANLGDWEETGLEKDEDFEVGFLRRGKRERGEIRVSMFGAQEKESCVVFFTDEAFFWIMLLFSFPKASSDFV